MYKSSTTFGSKFLVLKSRLIHQKIRYYMHIAYQVQKISSNFGIQFLSCNIKVSIHNINFFEARVLLQIFDIKLPFKCSYFEPVCLLAKMVSETIYTVYTLYSIISAKD